MDHRLVSYLYFFNLVGDYYECHEYGEHLWLDSGRPVILKGLIQAAVCLYHLYNGNVRGGWRMWQRARRYLETGSPVYQSLDIAGLIRDIDEVFARVPADWYTEHRPAEEIQTLHLPTVRIRILDAALTNILSTWRPEPLPDHG
ncbi:DUF309 domain-containing protein [Alicyclobacillus contaminans]|uniref:DUF309 domain-containing protein n=1 Tax=Alicyclobacillus contaminans TaxID=392016 RepID=UPI00041F8331|nr:DUF309 domain-containing protein [Alicyclobacillus contaminans]